MLICVDGPEYTLGCHSERYTEFCRLWTGSAREGPAQSAGCLVIRMPGSSAMQCDLAPPQRDPSVAPLPTKKLDCFTHRLGSAPLQRDSSLAATASRPPLTQNDTSFWFLNTMSPRAKCNQAQELSVLGAVGRENNLGCHSERYTEFCRPWTRSAREESRWPAARSL